MIQDDSVEMFFDIAIDAIIEEHDDKKYGKLLVNASGEPMEMNDERFMVGRMYWNDRIFDVIVKEVSDDI